MISRANRSTRRKPAPVPLHPPQTPHAARTLTRVAAVGSQRLTAWATARLQSQSYCRFPPISSSWLRAPWESRPVILFSNWTLGGSYVTSSLTRGRVCRLQLLLVLASAVILRPESRGTHNHILLSQIRDAPNLEGHVPLFTSPQEQGGSGTGFRFRRLLWESNYWLRHKITLKCSHSYTIVNRNPFNLRSGRDETVYSLLEENSFLRFEVLIEVTMKIIGMWHHVVW
jgi:hypothetical protein